MSGVRIRLATVLAHMHLAGLRLVAFGAVKIAGLPAAMLDVGQRLRSALAAE